MTHQERTTICTAEYDRHAVAAAIAAVNAALPKRYTLLGYIHNEPCQACDDATDGAFLLRDWLAPTGHAVHLYLCDLCCDRWIDAVEEM